MPRGKRPCNSVDEIVRGSWTGLKLARTTSQFAFIEDTVASSTCHDAIISHCQAEVLGRYVSHLEEREQVTSAIAVRWSPCSILLGTRAMT